MTNVCVHGFVSGKVQRVWFRGSMKQQADALGVTGWAKNLPDGRVEFLICGQMAKIAELQQWLSRGPTLAKVKEVVCEQLEWQDLETFSTS